MLTGYWILNKRSNMTIIYFIRHAESNHTITDDRNRPLTDKGMADCMLVTEYLNNKQIDVILSSPYKRAIDTIINFAESIELPIITIEDFRERENAWLEDNQAWKSFSKQQWLNFSYKMSGGESLAEVQKRNIVALYDVLEKYENKNIVIGTHGTALSTVIHYYDNTYGYEDFMAMVHLTPWVVKMSFNNLNNIGIEKINLFS